MEILMMDRYKDKDINNKSKAIEILNASYIAAIVIFALITMMNILIFGFIISSIILIALLIFGGITYLILYTIFKSKENKVKAKRDSLLRTGIRTKALIVNVDMNPLYSHAQNRHIIVVFLSEKNHLVIRRICTWFDNAEKYTKGYYVDILYNDTQTALDCDVSYPYSNVELERAATYYYNTHGKWGLENPIIRFWPGNYE
jgi:hypothetical protein